MKFIFVLNDIFIQLKNIKIPIFDILISLCLMRNFIYLRINKFIENTTQSYLKYEMCLFKNNQLIKFQTEKFYVFMEFKL